MKELKIITKDTLEDAADAIRTKLGTSDPIAPEDFDDKIEAIPTGITPTGTKSITANGTGIDVTEYAAVDVAVPGPTGTYWISENGTYDVTNYASVEVNVGGGEPSRTVFLYSETIGNTNQEPWSGTEISIDVTAQEPATPKVGNKIFGYVMYNGNQWTIFGECMEDYQSDTRMMRVRVMVSKV